MTAHELEVAITVAEKVTRQLIEARVFWESTTGDRKVRAAGENLTALAKMIGLDVGDMRQAAE